MAGRVVALMQSWARDIDNNNSCSIPSATKDALQYVAYFTYG